jgi:hypothetical protein
MLHCESVFHNYIDFHVWVRDYSPKRPGAAPLTRTGIRAAHWSPRQCARQCSSRNKFVLRTVFLVDLVQFLWRLIVSADVGA